jgi:hypothetical protein
MAVGSTYDAVTGEDVGSLKVPAWSWAEQQAIANYLDAETARIDAVIAKKRHLTDLLLQRRAGHVELAIRDLAEVASRGWCKRRGSQVPLIMLRGGYDSLGVGGGREVFAS